MIFELLLPNTNPVVVGTIYPPTKQTSFMEIFNENLCKVDRNNVKTYVLSDFNIMVITFSKNTSCFLKTNRGHSQSRASQK